MWLLSVADAETAILETCLLGSGEDVSIGIFQVVKWFGSQHKKTRKTILDFPHRDRRVCVHAQLCPTLCSLMEWSLPGSSVHGLSTQEYWSGLPFPSSRDLPDPGIKFPISCVSCLVGEFFTHSASIYWELTVCQATLSASHALNTSFNSVRSK